MTKIHTYNLKIEWTGNNGSGTKDYRAYSRDHIISSSDKPDIQGSSDPSFLGDKTKYNPEEMLLASISSCHMLWFLHLCADHKIFVVAYTDQPEATMQESIDFGGKFTKAILHPLVTVTESKMLIGLDDLHHQAHKLCFIANSINFPVVIEAIGRTS